MSFPESPGASTCQSERRKKGLYIRVVVSGCKHLCWHLGAGIPQIKALHAKSSHYYVLPTVSAKAYEGRARRSGRGLLLPKYSVGFPPLSSSSPDLVFSLWHQCRIGDFQKGQSMF